MGREWAGGDFDGEDGVYLRVVSRGDLGENLW